MKNSWKIA